MKKNTTIIAVTIVAISLALAGCSATNSGPTGTGNGSVSTATSAASAPHNKQDLTFAQGMLPHHKQAVEMSNMLLAKGTGVDPKVAELASTIKKEQSPEISTLTTWLKEWDQKTASSMHGSMTGMMSDGDMAALDRSSAADAGNVFLSQMIKHHEGAITMARTEVTSGQNVAAVELATAIVRSQSAEIDRMKGLLGSH